MNTKQVIIATLLVGGLGIWFLSGEDDPVPPAGPPPRQAPRQHTPVVPRQPPLPEPRDEYGSLGAPWGQAPYPDRRFQAAPYGTWGEDPYQTGAWADMGGYRFRPLTDQDRRRMGIPESAPSPSMPSQTEMLPAPYGTRGEGRYRFRSSAPTEGTSRRDEAPAQVPTWGSEPDYAEHWDLPPWYQPAPGSRPSWDPPARRMLPSLDSTSNRTVTAR